MRTHDDIWLAEPDAWGADRLAWEEDEAEPAADRDEDETVLEDPRY